MGVCPVAGANVTGGAGAGLEAFPSTSAWYMVLCPAPDEEGTPDATTDPCWPRRHDGSGTLDAGAITNGAPDANAHPFVGALLAPFPYSDGTWETRTGTLISPTAFLTAAHCDQGISRVAVTFDSSYNSQTGTTYWGTWHANPNYNFAQNNPQDVAVVVLDEPVTGIAPARLPTAGSLNGLRGMRFTSVGYGAQSVTIDKGPVFHYADVRYVATGRLWAVNKSWLRISMNPALGDGGTCYGDSGGPNFLGAGSGETNIVAATTITGDAMCRATNVDYRMDTPSARAFLGQYVTLP
jgi:V8-like Glu-specific endopeptidase